LEKFHFFGSYFSYEQDGHPNFKFGIDLEVLFIYRLVPRKSYFLGPLAIFDATSIGRILMTSQSVHDRTQHKRAGILVSVDRYTLFCVACEFWRCVVYRGSEK
jgi:hypothetical protein